MRACARDMHIIIVSFWRWWARSYHSLLAIYLYLLKKVNTMYVIIKLLIASESTVYIDI